MKLFGLLGVLVLLGSYPTLGSRAVIEKRQTPSDDCYFDTLPSNNVSVGPTCPNGIVVGHVRRCPIRVWYTGPGTCTTWRRINRITNEELEFDESPSGTSALFTPTSLESPLVQCIVRADDVSKVYEARFETVDGATCDAVEPTSTAQIDEPTATVPVPDPSSTVQETVGGTETSSVLTSPQPTPTRTPSAGDTDPSFDEAWRTGVIVAGCIVAFIVIVFILIFFTVCAEKRRNNPLPHHEQNPSNGSGGQGTCIPMECVQGDPPVNHGFAVEESGVEPPGPPNDVSGGGGDPTTTGLGLLSQCAFPSEKDGPTEQKSVGLEQPPPAFPPTEDRSAPVLDVSPHDSVELPGRTLYLVRADPDDGDVKSLTVFKKCTNESVLSSNHKLAIEDVKTAILHPLTHASSPSSLRSDTLSEPISLTQTPSLVLPSQPPSSCLSLNSPPTDSALPPNSPPTDSSLPPNSPPTDSSPTKAALADTESDDSGISSGDSEGSGGSGSEDDDQDSDRASGENTSACPESWCDAVLCNEIAPVEEQIITGNQDSTPPNQENEGEENESGGDIVYTTQLKKSRRLSRTHGARSRKDRVGPLERAGNTVNLTLSNSEWKPFAMNPELLQRDTMLLYAFDDINGLGSTVYQTVTAVQ